MKTVYDLRASESTDINKHVNKLFPEANWHQLQDIKACIGCWSCWLKTPGKCVWKDEMTAHYTDYVNSDSVILLLETKQGFIDGNAKAFWDRTIPHYLPFIRIEDGECHHDPRYDHYPDLYIHFGKIDLSTEEESVIEDYLYRAAYHFRSKIFRILDDGSVKPLKHRSAQPDDIQMIDEAPPEKVIVYNGSPRLKNSNSAILIDKFTETMTVPFEIRDLKELDNHDAWASSFQNEEDVIFFMPLYVHAMPSHVMKFFEKLAPSKGKLSFIVQSGFPESSQSHYLRPYLKNLTKRLNRSYVGTVIKGGVEGIQIRPEKSLRGLYENFRALGSHYSQYGYYPVDITEKLAKPVALSKSTLIIMKLLTPLKVMNFFWNKQLKDNNAFENRFDAPYKT